MFLNKFNRPLPLLIGIMTVGVVVVSVTTFAIIKTDDSQKTLDKMTVVVEEKSISAKIRASGTVEPIQSVNISPKNPGRLYRLLVEQGDQVKAGQTLAIMENDAIRAQGLQAQANLRQALATYERARQRIPQDINQAQARLLSAQAKLRSVQQSIPRDIDQANANLASAQAQLDLTKERAQRYQQLYQQGAVGKDRYDEALRDYREAQANFFGAQQRFNQAKNTSRPDFDQYQAEVLSAQADLEGKKRTAQSELDQLKASVESAQSALREIEIQFRDTIITAPFDGIISQKYATEGSFVTPTTSASNTASATSTSILALARGLEIIAKVPEVDIGQLKVGQPVEILADAFPDKTFQGRIKRIAPEAIVENNVTSFEVTVELLSGQAMLRSKMNIDVTFLGDKINNTVVVPTVAIVTENGQTGVMIPDEKKQPKFTPVTVGITIDDQSQILDGIKAGDRVFIELPDTPKSNK